MAGWFKKLLGDRGERLAAKFLRKRGFKIIARLVFRIKYVMVSPWFNI